MNNIIVKEVATRRHLKKFINFPNNLFKDVQTYIPCMVSDEMKLLTSKNPSLEHSDLKLFLAFDNNKIVGRVAAIINHTSNSRWNKRAVRFGWCDFVQDYDVFKLLMDKVVEFGKHQGMNEIEGPMGFTDMDKECWAIDNFDARQNLSTLYNPEYYVKYAEQYGMEIKCKWQQYKLPANQPVPPKVERINRLILEKYNLKLLKFKKRKEFYPYARKFFLFFENDF